MIRDATSDEIREVQQAVLRPHGPLPGDIDHPSDWLHVAAVIDATVVGACSVGPSPWTHPEIVELPAPQWQLRSMAVQSENRGGTGSQLLAAAMTRAQRAGAGSLWANARVEALNLYLRAGWRIVGEEWLKPGIGPHRWIVFDTDHPIESIKPLSSEATEE